MDYGGERELWRTDACDVTSTSPCAPGVDESDRHRSHDRHKEEQLEMTGLLCSAGIISILSLWRSAGHKTNPGATRPGEGRWYRTGSQTWNALKVFYILWYTGQCFN